MYYRQTTPWISFCKNYKGSFAVSSDINLESCKGIFLISDRILSHIRGPSKNEVSIPYLTARIL